MAVQAQLRLGAAAFAHVESAVIDVESHGSRDLTAHRFPGNQRALLPQRLAGRQIVFMRLVDPGEAILPRGQMRHNGL